jgi:hypothetical protein
MRERVKNLKAESDEDLQDLRQDLVEEMNKIDLQLSDNNRCDSDGKRITGDAYWDWRKRAGHAKFKIQGSIGRVNQELRKRGLVKDAVRCRRAIRDSMLATEIGFDALNIDEATLDKGVKDCCRAADLFVAALQRTGEEQ